MRDSSDFLADVRAAPNDDAPRLVCADWLEENGEATRAELIRVQCELGKLPWHSKRHQTLEKRELQLFRKYKDQWLGDFSTMVRSARFERGFVESVVLGAKQFQQHAESIFERAPVRKVALMQVSDKTAEMLATMPVLRKIVSFAISGSLMTDTGWRRLLTSAYLDGISRLELTVDFESGRTTAAGVLSALANCPSLPHLTELRTSMLHLDEVAAQGVLRSLVMPSLRSLSLPNARADVLGLICSAAYTPQYSELDVTGNGLGQSRSLRRMSAIAGTLKKLTMDNNNLSDRSIREMGSVPYLEELSVAFNQITDKGLVALIAQMPRLRRLTATSNRITGQHLGALRKSNHIADLEEFSTSNVSGFDKAGILDLVSCLRLKRLGLSSCGLTDAAAAPLLKSPNMSQLLWLDLSDNRLTDSTAKAIVDSPVLDDLRFLSLKENDVSADLKKALRSKYGTGVCTFSK